MNQIKDMHVKASLREAILSLKNHDEYRRFLRDLLTEAEI